MRELEGSPAAIPDCLTRPSSLVTHHASRAALQGGPASTDRYGRHGGASRREPAALRAGGRPARVSATAGASPARDADSWADSAARRMMMLHDHTGQSVSPAERWGAALAYIGMGSLAALMWGRGDFMLRHARVAFSLHLVRLLLCGFGLGAWYFLHDGNASLAVVDLQNWFWHLTGLFIIGVPLAPFGGMALPLWMAPAGAIWALDLTGFLLAIRGLPLPWDLEVGRVRLDSLGAARREGPPAPTARSPPGTDPLRHHHRRQRAPARTADRRRQAGTGRESGPPRPPQPPRRHRRAEPDALPRAERRGDGGDQRRARRTGRARRPHQPAPGAADAGRRWRWRSRARQPAPGADALALLRRPSAACRSSPTAISRSTRRWSPACCRPSTAYRRRSSARR